jgi:hypothetical protein
MALITEFTELQKERHQVHGIVECGYSIFEAEDGRYLQLDTFGSTERQIPGKTSQSIQLNERSAGQLRILIERAFPGIGS